MKLRKYKKYHKNKNIYKIEKNNSVRQGFYGVKAVNQGILTPKQIETARRTISRITGRSAKVLLRLNFEQPLTKKPLLTRMGKGCGEISKWISYIKKGKIIIEFLGVSKKVAIVLFKAIKKSLPLKFELIYREIGDA